MICRSRKKLSTFVFFVLIGLVVVPAWADNNGKLTVDNDTNKCANANGTFGYVFPDFSVIQGSIVHINISSAFSICTNSTALDDRCAVNADCDSNVGQCQTNNNCAKLSHCSAGNVGELCTTNTSCNISGVCSADASGTCTAGVNIGSSCTTAANCSSTGNLCTGTAPNKTCATGPRTGQSCSSNGQCDVSGTCTIPKHCTNSGATNGNSCSVNNDCNVPGTCTLDSTGICGGPLNPKVCSTSADCNACSGNSTANANGFCSTDTQCREQGVCESRLNTFCDSGPESIWITGHHGVCDPQNGDADCDTGETCDAQTCTDVDPTSNVDLRCSISNLSCTQDSDCSGVCSFKDQLTDSNRVGNGDINTCYNVREDWCGDATVQYCNEPPPDNKKAVVQNPQSMVWIPGNLVAVDSQGELAACSSVIPSCTNQVGSICCGLTQGAYGAPNSVATSLGTNPSDPCSGTNLGFLVAAFCSDTDGSCNPFDTDPNDSTVGVHPTRSVTMGPGIDFFDSLNSLISYLPSGGPAKQLSSVGDKHYPPNTSSGQSKGDGGGVLTGQAMATSLNIFLSDTCNPAWGGAPFQSGYTPEGFGGFKIPDTGVLVCTKRSGPNKVLGDADDVCEAFAYPTCTANQSVANVLAAANQFLGGGSNTLGCTATDYNNALSNINVQFDQCAEVIDCGAQSSAGVFTCP